MSRAYDTKRLVSLLPDEYRDLYFTERQAAQRMHDAANGHRPIPSEYRGDLDDLALIAVLLKHAGISTTADDLLLSRTEIQQGIEQARLDDEVNAQRRRQQAREALAAEQAATLTIPAPVDLDEFIYTHADTETTWRVDRLSPLHGLTLLAAAAKTGKTTLTGNLIRCLADGTPFLDTYAVEPAHGIVLIDTEMTPGQLARWMDRQNIQHTDHIKVHALRGQLSSFNILDPDTRAKWARTFAGAEVVILDNLRPVIDALGLDENREAGQLLEAWKELITEAGATDSFIVTHMGHNAERARGDSTLQDKPDALWIITRDKTTGDEGGDAPRYFGAEGRDVLERKRSLEFDPDTGRLTLGTEGPAHPRLNDVAEAVHAFLRRSPGTSLTGIRKAVNGRNEIITAAVDSGVEQGLIVKEKRQQRGGGNVYSLTPENKSSQPVPTLPGTS